MSKIFEYKTPSGLTVKRKIKEASAEAEKSKLTEKLNTLKGVYLKSSFEYPGRYKRWDTGFINPPVEIRTRGYDFTISMLNERGIVIVENISKMVEKLNFIEEFSFADGIIRGRIKESKSIFSEENRSRKNTVFSMLRCLMNCFKSSEDHVLGLYGAFGYDLIFQFEDVEMRSGGRGDVSDMVLYIPDRIFISDNEFKEAYIYSYEFEYGSRSTRQLSSKPFRDGGKAAEKVNLDSEFVKGSYASVVSELKEYFRRGDLFEVVPSHEITSATQMRPSVIFDRLTKINPSPYGFFINMGEEYLIGASPEMFVRVDGKRIETCPISGTIKRGKNAIEDSMRIHEILNSEKDESELTMCTDVDRNDKSRVCIPGTVKVIGRRQIEMYSHLIHTVDHVEGMLREDVDGLDGFMSHMWAVTVTGAPKKAAIEWIEEHENTPRRWYGGAVGFLRFDGSVNTGLTLRTIRLKDDAASIRVGATVLYDSDPSAEEEETFVKAGALLSVLNGNSCRKGKKYADENTYKKTGEKIGDGMKVLFADHEDSFVNTLADYFRRTGASVETFRSKYIAEIISGCDGGEYDLIVLSPGPGTPDDFNLKVTIDKALEKKIPIFGICLGLQGIVEYFGGKLGRLERPFHGKISQISRVNRSETILFEGIPKNFDVGRYHSLYASSVPKELRVSAMSRDGIVMAVEHESLPVSAVQFHPESIMTMANDVGYKIIENVVLNSKKYMYDYEKGGIYEKH